MNTNSSFRAMLLALVLTLTGCLHDTPSEENFWGVELPEETAADFTLVDQHGDNFSFGDTLGKVVVMTFVYTHCPDVCPAVTYQLTKLQEALGGDYGERVEILSITVDPERDTVEHLAQWAMMRNASWPHLTSSDAMPEMAMNSSVWGPYGIYVEKMLEDQEMEIAPADHSLVIMLPDNSTAAVEVPASAFDSAATMWNLTQKGLEELQLDYNYTGADSITNVSGHEANANWSWTLHAWNASSGGWEPAGANATEIPLTESAHAAWVPGNANTSQLPLPSAFTCDGHGWLMGEGSGMHCMCDEGYGWSGQDRLSCVLTEGAGGYGDYGISHSTILYIIDQQGRLKVAWPGLDWTYRDIHHDVALLLD
ncbi:MAG: hypothetical protein CL960_02450 [Euryarchaeota archaeon]|nr:hypothetical protein [Euryarchaeota archaeon]MDP6363459.1 SCO family protein [Candidatus Poseidoniia archaeon]MAH17345.1 hypothetical protein [Euryarchaeota archaeon]MDP6658594.1 SCO family protein [Candidatus Poseidoniia archaeon]MDP6846030.1 SCO family protein [Candidatus Poseidoniia archaeon]